MAAPPLTPPGSTSAWPAPSARTRATTAASTACVGCGSGPCATGAIAWHAARLVLNDSCTAAAAACTAEGWLASDLSCDVTSAIESSTSRVVGAASSLESDAPSTSSRKDGLSQIGSGPFHRPRSLAIRLVMFALACSLR